MRALAVLLLLAAGCQEPPKTPQYVMAVQGLIDLHKWDPSTEGQGQYGYDAVMGAWPEVAPSLVAHLTDETPTMLYDQVVDRRVLLGDVCYYMLLKLTGLNQKEFVPDGVFISTALPNPIFCVRWKEPTLESRRRVQQHFQKIITPPEDP